MCTAPPPPPSSFYSDGTFSRRPFLSPCFKLHSPLQHFWAPRPLLLRLVTHSLLRLTHNSFHSAVSRASPSGRMSVPGAGFVGVLSTARPLAPDGASHMGTTMTLRMSGSSSRWSNPCPPPAVTPRGQCPVSSVTTGSGRTGPLLTVCPEDASFPTRCSSILTRTTSHSNRTGLWAPSSPLLWPSMVRPGSLAGEGPQGGRTAGGGPARGGVAGLGVLWFLEGR